jgi:DNA-binding MarR family transcriptional regulator
MGKRRHNKTGRSTTERHIRLPHYLLRSQAWLHLSLAGRALFVEALAEYNGSNNGSIALSVRAIAERLRVGKSTVSRALLELEEKGFIETVRMGSFTRKNRRASEYLLTLHRSDTGRHQSASKRFMQWVAADGPISGTEQTHHRYMRNDVAVDGPATGTVEAK